jgi:hypothetical protein
LEEQDPDFFADLDGPISNQLWHDLGFFNEVLGALYVAWTEDDWQAVAVFGRFFRRSRFSTKANLRSWSRVFGEVTPGIVGDMDPERVWALLAVDPQFERWCLAWNGFANSGAC